MDMTGENKSVDAVVETDVDRLAANAAKFIEQAGKVGAAYLRPREEGAVTSLVPDEAADMVKTIGAVAESWLKDPVKAIEAQTSLSTNFVNLWAETLKGLQGEPVTPVVEPSPRDKRFADSDWSTNPYFSFLKQAYLITSNWAETMVEKADGLDRETKQKAEFYVRQLSGALSPSNFLPTNPELIRTTLQENGENLVRGMKMLAEDIEAGKGELKIRQSDNSGFKVGENIATTPGKVVYRNAIMELIQYEPTTPSVLARPLVIAPPWINKFYVLDLNPEKSFIRWAVSQGVTVFVISWVNPDERHKTYDFEGYMREGLFEAIDRACDITGADDVHAVGYCVGGTLLAVTLAYMAAKKDKRIAQATFLTTQVDFTNAGDLKVFADETQIKAVEDMMAKYGYLPGTKMAGAFNMLRPLDLIWPYVINNYVKGKQPMAFDLLYWNADATRMPEANHKFYLRNCYLENKLAKGEMKIGGVKLDLSKVKIPIYNLAAREDHIAPARSVFFGSKLFGGPVRFVLSGSGHIAGVVNPATKPKYQYWTGGRVEGELEDWLENASETPGSWWVDWRKWYGEIAPKETKPPKIGNKRNKPICDAPGEYVRVKA
ncbi:MAG: class I poly(R)-hydroxyalkanoic acid synthase [Beijerinckiaceae bacterium]|nr:class I poly(R)-hydroxyalkanoic acid synthase [Beijerinckiaceae bacterium]